jgi:hypothetical protein
LQVLASAAKSSPPIEKLFFSCCFCWEKLNQRMLSLPTHPPNLETMEIFKRVSTYQSMTCPCDFTFFTIL